MINRIKELQPCSQTKNGTLLYGDVQALYREEKKKYTVMGCYVHVVYPPLSDNMAIEQLKKEIPFLSDDYLCFLKKYNGLNLFSTSFCLYGFGRLLSDGLYIVSRDPDIMLPFHLGDYNKSGNETYEIGTFCECKLVNDTVKQRYFLLNKKNTVVAEWETVQDLINDCIGELSIHFSEDGKAKTPKVIGKYIFNKIVL